jgi:hypothetical protein
VSCRSFDLQPPFFDFSQSRRWLCDSAIDRCDAHAFFGSNSAKDIITAWDAVIIVTFGSKWAAVAKCSQDTALRDISELLDRGVLRRSEARGWSTSYELAPLE